MKKLRAYADLPIRLSGGLHLIYGTQDNILSWNQMLEFRDFLEVFGFPLPLFAAITSVYAQFIAGILFIIGWKVRAAGTIMVVNFLIAIFMVHTEDPYMNVYPAISMLSVSIFLMMFGAGKISLEALIAKKAAN